MKLLKDMELPSLPDDTPLGAVICLPAAAERADIHVDTIYAAVKDGRLTVYRVELLRQVVALVKDIDELAPSWRKRGRPATKKTAAGTSAAGEAGED